MHKIEIVSQSMERALGREHYYAHLSNRERKHERERL